MPRVTYPQGQQPYPQQHPQQPHQQGYQQPYPQQQWQSAPQVTLPPDPANEPVPKALRVVVVLLFVNLGLSLLTAVLSYLLRDQLLDYQLGHMNLDPRAEDITRDIYQKTMMIRMASIAVVALLYLWLANRLLKGKRWAYRRSLMLGIFGLVGLVVLTVTTKYPMWLHVEQGVQAAILIALLVALTRPEVRSRFRKVRY